MKSLAKTETLQEFAERNISKWCCKGQKFNNGNINILQYAYYARIRSEREHKIKHPKSITQWFIKFMQKGLFYQPMKIDSFQTKMFS